MLPTVLTELVLPTVSSADGCVRMLLLALTTHRSHRTHHHSLQQWFLEYDSLHTYVPTYVIAAETILCLYTYAIIKIKLMVSVKEISLLLLVC